MFLASFIFFLFLPIFSFGQYLNPSDTYILSSGPSEGYDRPRVVITANNSPFVIWSKPSAPKAIKSRKWNGTDFDSAADLVNADLMLTGFIGPEIAAAVNTPLSLFRPSFIIRVLQFMIYKLGRQKIYVFRGNSINSEVSNIRLVLSQCKLYL